MHRVTNTYFFKKRGLERYLNGNNNNNVVSIRHSARY